MSTAAHFRAANATAGTLDLSLYTLISGVVGPTNVLSGHNNYSGGSAGSLTLPAVGNVLTGSGTYGVAGAGSTPTLTLPAVGNVLIGTTYGNPGSVTTGTRTDCPAANGSAAPPTGPAGHQSPARSCQPSAADAATA